MQRYSLGTTLSRVPTMLLLFSTAAAFEAKNLSSLSYLSNGDVWWHLRTGIWMLQTHILPHNGLFSQSAELHWQSSSWLYDLLVASAFRMLGLLAIPLLLMAFKLLLALVTFFVAGGLRGRFWPAVLLSAVSQYILGSVPLGPGYGSILFFGIELFLLIEVRHTVNERFLFWLPPLFLLWANLDVQFVYGILLFVLFLIAFFLRTLQPRTGAGDTQLEWAAGSSANVGIVAMLCGIATLITPYTYHFYGVFFTSVTSGANRYLSNFHAPGFRQPQDYILLLLTMAAYLALGMRRSRDPFQIGLMIGCSLLSFYAQRNSWLVALAAIAVIGEAMREHGIRDTTSIADANTQYKRSRQLLSAGGLSIGILLMVAAVTIPRGNEALLAKAGESYPVAACNYIREHRLPQPLFNSYPWGGFLTWYLPEYPVAIDSRAGLYDDDFIAQYFKVMNADSPYQSYPAMAQAGTLLLERKSVMGQALSSVPAFRVAYSDSVAVVLTKP